jgi:hypothetical protein
MERRYRRSYDVKDRRKVKGPVAAFDRIAKAAERARGRLREDSEIDQIAVDVVFERA